MTFDEWWKDYGKNRDSSEYVVARAAYNAGMEEDFNYATKVINDRDVIINFLKKELIKKTSYRQVMKRQYRELKQKYDALKEDYELMKHCRNCKYNHIYGCDYHSQGECDYITKRKWELCK